MSAPPTILDLANATLDGLSGKLDVNGDGSQLAGVLKLNNLAAALTSVIASLPTTLPNQPGVLWNNGGVIQIS